MHIGHYISGAGHAGLIGWALFGGMFAPPPDPFQVTEVSVVSVEEFEAILAAQRAPSTVTEIALPNPPEPEETAPELDSVTDRAPSFETPQATQPDTPDSTPEVAEPLAPPQDDIADEVPDLGPAPSDTAILIPEVQPDSSPRSVPRVAPTPIAPPDPGAAIDDALREAALPADEPEEVVPEQESTAPEEATTEIVTEAEDSGSAAPIRSVRPQLRPTRPSTPRPAVAQPVESEPAPADPGGINAALAEALGDPSPASAPSGPPMTSGEKDALRIGVQQCWVVDVGSQAANVTVTVGMSMNRDGTVQSGSLKLISATGGDGRAAEVAFQAARRAILRCQKGGYNLPIEKYDHWRDIEMTFNPENMRIK